MWFLAPGFVAGRLLWSGRSAPPVGAVIFSQLTRRCLKSAELCDGFEVSQRLQGHADSRSGMASWTDVDTALTRFERNEVQEIRNVRNVLSAVARLERQIVSAWAWDVPRYGDLKTQILPDRIRRWGAGAETVK